MADESDRTASEAEAARAKQKEGSGAVPNVTEEEARSKSGERKNALHAYEEQKGDWSKTGG